LPFKKPRGVHFERKKDSSLLNTLKRPFAPKKVRVPLYAGPHAGVMPCVGVGEIVKTGQKIAHPKNSESVPIYASLSGKVEKIEPELLPDGRECLAVEILGDGEPGQGFQGTETKRDISGISREELLSIFREQGLLTMDLTMIPVHERIRKKAYTQTIVINGCEQEPYLTCDQFLLGSRAVEVLKGIDLLRRASGAEKVIIVMEDANREECEIIKSKIYLSKWKSYEARMIPSFYPLGTDEFLMKMFPGNTMIWNAPTAYAAYEAVYFQKPFYERIVTVAGECVAEPRNLLLPFGLSCQDAVQCCKGLLREPKKVLIGGPMTGLAQPDLEQPVITAGTNAVLAVPPEVAKDLNEQPCIRCNRCVDTCPAGISPVMITLAAERGEYEVAENWGLEACVECGVCTYICPSERPMANMIRQAKEKTGVGV
jgi:electron transport complex protein RnfC